MLLGEKRCCLLQNESQMMSLEDMLVEAEDSTFGCSSSPFEASISRL